MILTNQVGQKITNPDLWDEDQDVKGEDYKTPATATKVGSIIETAKVQVAAKIWVASGATIIAWAALREATKALELTKQ